jgi:hypothetical protein
VGTFFAADGSEKLSLDSAPSVRVLGGTVPTPSYRPAIVYNFPFKIRERDHKNLNFQKNNTFFVKMALN